MLHKVNMPDGVGRMALRDGGRQDRSESIPTVKGERNGTKRGSDSGKKLPCQDIMSRRDTGFQLLCSQPVVGFRVWRRQQ